jgi:hypothetical protein
MAGIGEIGCSRELVGQSRFHLPKFGSVQIIHPNTGGLLSFEMRHRVAKSVMCFKGKQSAPTVDHSFHTKPSGELRPSGHGQAL